MSSGPFYAESPYCPADQTAGRSTAFFKDSLSDYAPLPRSVTLNVGLWERLYTHFFFLQNVPFFMEKLTSCPKILSPLKVRVKYIIYPP